MMMKDLQGERLQLRKAQERILEQLKPEPTCVIFSFPRERHGENTINK